MTEQSGLEDHPSDYTPCISPVQTSPGFHVEAVVQPRGRVPFDNIGAGNAIRSGLVTIGGTRKRVSAALLSIAAAVGPLALLRTSSARGPTTADRASTVVAIRSPQTVGAGQCSAAACHGSPKALSRKTIARDEYTQWVTLDPHANAYHVLYSPLAEQMARKLGRGRESYPAAHNDERCLACHATPVADPAAQRDAEIWREGVGCEACHGPAELWLGAHLTEDWRKSRLPAELKETRFGIRPTKDLVQRAAICAGCHIGEPAVQGRPRRDVDHDLIAAGHPPLRFEFGSYLANIPHHWQERGRNTERDFPARTWVIGQVVSANAALELLHSRALAAAEASKVPRREATWPELSEYDCSSCHHALSNSPSPARPTRAEGGHGKPTWGTWYVSQLEPIANSGKSGAARSVLGLLKPVREAMESDRPADQIAIEADKAARELARWIAALGQETIDADRAADLVRRLDPRAEQLGPSRSLDWESEALRFLALAPLCRALDSSSPDVPSLRVRIEGMRKRFLNDPGPLGTGLLNPEPARRGP